MENNIIITEQVLLTIGISSHCSQPTKVVVETNVLPITNRMIAYGNDESRF